MKQLEPQGTNQHDVSKSLNVGRRRPHSTNTRLTVRDEASNTLYYSCPSSLFGLGCSEEKTGFSKSLWTYIRTGWTWCGSARSCFGPQLAKTTVVCLVLVQVNAFMSLCNPFGYHSLWDVFITSITDLSVKGAITRHRFRHCTTYKKWSHRYISVTAKLLVHVIIDDL